MGLTEFESKIANTNLSNTYNKAGHLTKLNNKAVDTSNIGKPLSIGKENFEYDALGNRTKQTNNDSLLSKNYAWNTDGTLLETTDESSAVKYEYSANNLIETRIRSGIKNNFVWDETKENPLLLSDGEYEYIYGEGRVPLAQVNLSTGATEYLHSDINGSVIAATSEEGNLAGIANYDSYGRILSAPISNFGYAGEWTDTTTGHIFLRARWYDPNTGHFLSKDPLYEITGESYGYANGNPLSNIDPSGMFINPVNWIKDGVRNSVNAAQNMIQKAKDTSEAVYHRGKQAIKKGTAIVSSASTAVAEATKKAVIEAGVNVRNGAVSAFNSTMDWVRNADWDKIGGTIAVIGTGAALAAFVIGTGGTGAFVLGAIGTAATISGSTISGLQTYNTCMKGDSKECSWGIINTISGALPVGLLLGKGAKASKIAMGRKKIKLDSNHPLATYEANAKILNANSIYLGANTAGLGTLGLSSIRSC